MRHASEQASQDRFLPASGEGRSSGGREAERPAPDHAFCLLVEELAGVVGGGGREADDRQVPAAVLRVPAGVSALSAPTGEPPAIRSADGETDGRRLLLEPIRVDHRWRLLLVGARPGEVELNGAAAPPVALLQERDRVVLRSTWHLLHVSLYVRPYVGPARSEDCGRPCSLCGVPIDAATRVYGCPYCQAPCHHQIEPAPGETEPLQCAQVSPTCPACLRDIAVEEGLTWLPEDLVDD